MAANRSTWCKSYFAAVLAVLVTFPSILISASPRALPVTDTGVELEHVILHAHSGTAFDPVFIQLLHALQRPGRHPGVQVWMVIRHAREEAPIRDRLRAHGLGGWQSRLHFTALEAPYNVWARDLYAPFQAGKGYRLQPLASRPEADGQLPAQHLASAVPHLSAAETVLPLAGGDLASDDRYLYLGEDSLRRLQALRHLDRAGALEHLAQLYQKEVFVLPGLDEHQDRYHMPLGVLKGKRTSLVADPRQALEMLAALSAEEKKAAAARFEAAYLERGPAYARDLENFFTAPERWREKIKGNAYAASLDETARQLESNGIRVVRVPGLHRKMFPDEMLPAGLYYVNLIQDAYRDTAGRIRHKIILPGYGIPALDTYVQQQLQALEGIDEIRMVPAIREGFRGAGIRCLVQTLGRESINPVAERNE